MACFQSTTASIFLTSGYYLLMKISKKSSTLSLKSKASFRCEKRPFKSNNIGLKLAYLLRVCHPACLLADPPHSQPYRRPCLPIGPSFCRHLPQNLLLCPLP